MKRSFSLLPFALLFSMSLGAENQNGQTTAEPNALKEAEKCALTILEAPALLKMRLGMSLEETKAAAPNLGLSRRIQKANGVSKSLSSKPDDEVEGVVNSYLDDKLFEIDILYRPANRWKETFEFVREFSGKFNLPEQLWMKMGDSNNYLLTCQGFTIEIRDRNHIVLSGAAAKTVNESAKN